MSTLKFVYLHIFACFNSCGTIKYTKLTNKLCLGPLGIQNPFSRSCKNILGALVETNKILTNFVQFYFILL